MDKRYTYQEEIEQKRLWLERKIKRELKIVINAIIDKHLERLQSGCVDSGFPGAYKGNRVHQPQIPNGVPEKRNPGAGIKYQDVRKKRSVQVL